MVSLPNPPSPTIPPLVPSLPIPQCVMFPSLCLCSHCSTPTYEWEHAVFGFLFLCQFAEDDGFQLHPCSCKGRDLIPFYGFMAAYYSMVYMLWHFLYPVYHWWAFGLVSYFCYCKQCSNRHKCACVFIVEWYILIWVYSQQWGYWVKWYFWF